MYMAIHQAREGTNTPWDMKASSGNKYVRQFHTEGYYYQLKRMLELGIVDEVLMLIETVRETGCFSFGPKFTGYVLPEMWQARQFIRENDIIWCRGGFRSWFNFLNLMVDTKHWTLCYAANTGRQKWPFWHVILDDLLQTHGTFMDKRGRLIFDFKKATNPKLFKPQALARDFDVCVGASHIHDKKAQWKMIDACIEYKKRYGRNLKCVMPGVIQHGVNTNQIIGKIKTHGLDVQLPGMLPREKMPEIYNRSKVFVHLGGGGQNDRGPLESMRCGTPSAVETPLRHARFISQCPVNFVSEYANYPKDLAEEVHVWVEKSKWEDSRARVHAWHEEHSGIENVLMPDMKKLFDFFRGVPKADREALGKYYESI